MRPTSAALGLTALMVLTPVRASAVSDAPPGPTPVAADLAGRAWTSIPTHRKVVALTFDAGAGSGGVTKILAALRKYDVPATFFLTGTWARMFPAKVRSIAQGGYVLGNHTDTHGSVPSMSDARLAAELRATDAAVTKAAGRGTQPWFRFPYGAHRQSDVRRVNGLGYACIQWTIDTAGWTGTSGGQSAAGVVSRVVDGLRPGAIVLMHVGQNPDDGSTLDADALPRIIEALRARGYEFTTVEALLPG